MRTRQLCTLLYIKDTQVQDNIKSVLDNESSGVITACFLVQEGADIYQRNSKGHTPLQLSQPKVITVVMTCVASTSSFHGSMKCPSQGGDGVSQGGNIGFTTPAAKIKIGKNTLVASNILSIIFKKQRHK
jgi:hypothetical protein